VPGPALVRGRVTDESGRPLPAAQVVVEGTGVGALTGRDGTFELALDRLPADSTKREVMLKARLIGYREVTHALAMRGGDVASTDFRLAPQTMALDAMVVTGTTAAARQDKAAPSEIVVPIDDATRGSWRTVSRADAEAEAGFRLLSVPDLRVVRIDIGNLAGVVLVRVVQALDGGADLELVQARNAVRFGAATPADGRARASVRRGDVSVAAAAPVAADALAALLERLR
jgi:hypothetical protein